jgi:beta-N-acetylhexosaminidase
VTARAVIFGLAGPALSDWERGFFAQVDPLGFILFARNCQSPDQLRALVAELRLVVDRPDAPILIDQEGGRVARLRPPHWRAVAPAGRFGTLAEQNLETALGAVRLNARLIAAELAELGVSVDCAPVLDLQLRGAHEIVGDRSFGEDPARVAALGRAFCEGLIAGGILPVIKHIPGHGRALADSHHELPRVSAERDSLSASDFAPFRALSDMPWAMTGHIVYEAVDARRPATTSPEVISEVIRGEIGFEGVLVSDDLSMSALEGELGARAEAALAAGCDLVLHCNGEAAEMIEVARVVPELDPAALARLERAAACVAGGPESIDLAEAKRSLDAVLAKA